MNVSACALCFNGEQIWDAGSGSNIESIYKACTLWKWVGFGMASRSVKTGMLLQRNNPEMSQDHFIFHCTGTNDP